MTEAIALQRFRLMMLAFIAGLVVSGLTAFPLLTEMRWLTSWLGLQDATSAAGHAGVSFWILTVRFGLEDMYVHHPWIGYGTDWLAFGHIVIALFFIGPMIRPRESGAVIGAGIAACILVIPLALICGSIRGIPLYWRLIDCSFGVFGIIPLLYCRRLIAILERNSLRPE